MSLKIRRAAVLGAGVMGAQIAALLAAAGVRTHLLDLAANEPPKDPAMAKAIGKNFRSARALGAVEALKTLKPTPLYSPSVLASVIPGNFDDDLSVLAECDWIIEAVIERLDIKKSLHARIAEYARPHVPVTTNTSGISLVEITKDLPEEYQQRFFGTHFFNPPRYMRLLEVVPHPNTDRGLMDALTAWIEERLGKGIVEARDTVNFIANRIGVFATQSALKHMQELGLNIETVDALTGPLIGRAKSATCRTMDVVGLDTFAAVARNTYTLAPKDPYRDLFQSPKWLEELIEKGALGQKTPKVGGCYLKSKGKGGESVILAYRPESKTYAPQEPMHFGWEAEAAKERDTIKRIKLVISQNDKGGQFAWRVMRDVFSYAALLLEEIAGGQPKSVDEALKWGFNWEMGPFELWQALGTDDVSQRIQGDKTPLPAWIKPGLSFYEPVPASRAWFAHGGPTRQLSVAKNELVPVPQPSWAYHLPLAESKDDQRVVLSNKSTSLVDIGDGVACLVFHSKMNSIDLDLIDMTQKAVQHVSQHFDALVIGNEGGNFSAGANLKMIAEAIHGQKWGDIDRLLRGFQGALSLVKYAAFPTVACPYGMTLGGGCEVALQAPYRVAAGETYAGLVEAGVGLIPAGGGTKELALRAYELMSVAEKGDPMPFLSRAFMLIAMGRVSSSAAEAVEMGLFPSTTLVSLSREHLIDKAKRYALTLQREGYVPRTPAQGIKVVGDPGLQTFKLMLYNMVEGRQISAYDAKVAASAALVLVGGEIDTGTPVGEQHFLDLERRAFLDLCKEPKTLERIEHMLKTGKPLRN